MNCMSAKVKRNKEMLSRKEYQERVSELTPEERQVNEKCTRKAVEEWQKAVEVLNTTSCVTGGIYSDEIVWRK